jgi:thimet oligopeptidase
MKLGTVAWAALSATLPAGAGAASASLPPGFPVMGARELTVRCDEELEKRRQMLGAMAAHRGPGQILQELNSLSLRVGNFDSPLAVLQNAAPDAETRAAAAACLEKLLPFSTELFQSEAVYARVRELVAHDPQDIAYRGWLLENFEDAGVTLPPAPRARVKQIQDELQSLGLRFQKAVNDDDTSVLLQPAELDGLPASWLAAHPAQPDGTVRMGLSYPSYLPFMESARDAAARQRVWTAFQGRGGPANLALLDRAVALRSELAGLYGFADFATFSMRRKMAGKPQAVADFLASVHQAVDTLEGQELEELRVLKAGMLGQPVAAVRVERWDLAFLQRQVRQQRFQIDAEALRANFPTDVSVRFAMALAETLYGIRFIEREVPVWAPGVRYYEVAAAGTGEPVPFAAVYLDLFPRAGKYSHAAAFGVRSGSVLTGQHPVKALICNLDPKGLTPDELSTLLHEFGHLLHGVLSRARYADQSGTSVRWDFVEAPSLMFEEWARSPESLRLFARLCPQCPPLSETQIARLDAAHRYGSGMHYSRQWLLASFDLALHTGAPKGALQTWTDLENATRLGHVPGTMMPASFGHLMGGYEAGYYGYMWAEVLALDMASVFRGHMLDPAVGRRYRHSILEPGGSRPPMELVHEFLGRDPDASAFLARLAGK